MTNTGNNMLHFKDFIVENKEVPFDKTPQVGWWKDKAEKDGYHTVYHGTHVRNLPNILKNGLAHKDPRTGMISVTHDLKTALAYAGMSGGESNFRKAGSKAEHVPYKDRVAIKIHLPISHRLDGHLQGNIGDKRDSLHSKEKYINHNKNGKSDEEYYQTTELRTPDKIPPEHIKGYVKHWMA